MALTSIQYVSVSPDAVLPLRGFPRSGFKLHSVINATILAKTRMLVPTGIAIEIPNNYTAHLTSQCLPESGAAYTVSTALDRNFRGQLSVLVVNNTNYGFEIRQRDPIGNLVFTQTTCPTGELVTRLPSDVGNAEVVSFYGH